jgi:hypothetical protein
MRRCWTVIHMRDRARLVVRTRTNHDVGKGGGGNRAAPVEVRQRGAIALAVVVSLPAHETRSDAGVTQTSTPPTSCHLLHGSLILDMVGRLVFISDRLPKCTTQEA